MAEYIEREALIQSFDCNGGRFTYGKKTVEAIVSRINMQPVADVVEVVHGEWEKVKYIEGCLNSYQHTCGYCGKSYFDNNVNDYPFCPLCGAKMDGAE